MRRTSSATISLPSDLVICISEHINPLNRAEGCSTRPRGENTKTTHCVTFAPATGLTCIRQQLGIVSSLVLAKSWAEIIALFDPATPRSQTRS